MNAKVVVLGLDAMEPKLIDKLIEEGDLPNLKALLECGVSGRVANPARIFSGASWPNFYTGVGPGRHQQYLRIRFNPSTYELYPYRPSQDQFPPFWKQDAWKNRKIALLHLPYCPLDPDINGIQIMDFAMHDRHEHTVCVAPKELESEILESYGSGVSQVCDSGERSIDEAADLREELLDRIRTKTRMATDLFSRQEWDLFINVFDEPHCAGHIFWHLRDKDNDHYDPEAYARLGDVVREVYMELDASIGKLRAMTDDQTHFFVVSSHGMGKAYDASASLGDIVTHVMGKPEYSPTALQQRRSRIKQMSSLYSRLPSFLKKAALPLKDRFGHKGLLQKRINVRMQSPVFAFPTNAQFMGLRLNRAGRESHGFSESELKEFMSRLKEELSEVHDGKTGELLLDVIEPVDKNAFAGYDGELPDLIVKWRWADVREMVLKDGSRIKTKLVRGRSGDHDIEMLGFFVLCGPSVYSASEKQEVAALEDFAPTISELLGIGEIETEGQAISGSPAAIV